MFIFPWFQMRYMHMLGAIVYEKKENKTESHQQIIKFT